jgi:hypothetical protein
LNAEHDFLDKTHQMGSASGAPQSRFFQPGFPFHYTTPHYFIPPASAPEIHAALHSV